MSRITFGHEFVEYIPSAPRPSMLYISTMYNTVVHLCACSCGTKVVTPLSPADWRLTYDGETISLSPSIGNWGFPCRSHYWITRSEVRWAKQWTDAQIAAGRLADAADRDEYLSRRVDETSSAAVPWWRSLWRRRAVTGKPGP